MLQIVFPNESQEIALKLRDQIHKSLEGNPAYVKNNIILCSQNLDPSGKPLVDDGDIRFVQNGAVYEHCIIVSIKYDYAPDDDPIITIISKDYKAYV